VTADVGRAGAELPEPFMAGDTCPEHYSGFSVEQRIGEDSPDPSNALRFTPELTARA
jgi:hypothetical protein